MELRLGKQRHVSGVVVVHVSDDDILNGLRIHADGGEPFRNRPQQFADRAVRPRGAANPVSTTIVRCADRITQT